MPSFHNYPGGKRAGCETAARAAAAAGPAPTWGQSRGRPSPPGRAPLPRGTPAAAARRAAAPERRGHLCHPLLPHTPPEGGSGRPPRRAGGRSCHVLAAGETSARCRTSSSCTGAFFLCKWGRGCPARNPMLGCRGGSAAAGRAPAGPPASPPPARGRLCGARPAPHLAAEGALRPRPRPRPLRVSTPRASPPPARGADRSDGGWLAGRPAVRGPRSCPSLAPAPASQCRGSRPCLPACRPRRRRPLGSS